MTEGWNIPALKTLLEEILPLKISFDNFEVEHDFIHIGPRTMLLNARCFPPEGRLELILLAIEDITDRKQSEMLLTDAECQKDEIHAQEAILHDRVARDLRAAAKIQETFLPRELPCVPGVSFAWLYRPCDELAGDGLNVIMLGERRIALYILDVSGHGIAPVLLAMAMSRILSSPSEPTSILTRDGDVVNRRPITSPAEVADRSEELFPFNTTTERFATMIYGVLDTNTGEFRYVAAGHPGPLCLPAEASPVIHESPGFPIGLAEKAYEERSVQMAVGDRLYLYSDGVLDAMAPSDERTAPGGGRSGPVRAIAGKYRLLGRGGRAMAWLRECSRRHLHCGG
jgi:serine phosphatase RsbU (regulator of sigma subunit)